MRFWEILLQLFIRLMGFSLWVLQTAQSVKSQVIFVPTCGKITGDFCSWKMLLRTHLKWFISNNSHRRQYLNSLNIKGPLSITRFANFDVFYQFPIYPFFRVVHMWSMPLLLLWHTFCSLSSIVTTPNAIVPSPREISLLCLWTWRYLREWWCHLCKNYVPYKQFSLSDRYI